jgi:hypothetical protein
MQAVLGISATGGRKVINLKTVEEATYTTGNTIITGENPATGVMANVWHE